MKFYKMQCPSCGANLEVENELDSFFCKYCGTKIYVAEQDPEIVKAKASVRITNTNAELEHAKMQHELELKKQEESKNIRDIVLGLVLTPIAIAVCALCFKLLVLILS